MAARLLVPRDHLKARPANESEYLAAAEKRAALAGRDVIEDERTLVAYVNHGMWVADCHYCNSGIAIHPEWGVAACLGLGCHRVYRSIEIPPEWQEIEAVLIERPMRNQHWLTSESVEKLVEENVRNGYPTGVTRSPAPGGTRGDAKDGRSPR